MAEAVTEDVLMESFAWKLNMNKLKTTLTMVGQLTTGKKQQLLESVLECIKKHFWTLSMNDQHGNNTSFHHLFSPGGLLKNHEYLGLISFLWILSMDLFDSI